MPCVGDGPSLTEPAFVVNPCTGGDPTLAPGAIPALETRDPDLDAPTLGGGGRLGGAAGRGGFGF